MSPKKAAAVTDRRSQQALDIFERAAKALGKHEWERARTDRITVRSVASPLDALA